MENLTELLTSVLNSSVGNLRSYVDLCEEHISFHEKNKKTQEFIKLVNASLNETKNRLNGLIILDVALRQCSEETFADYATTWLACSLRGTYDKDPNVVNVSFSVLGTLLKTAVKFPEIKKHASAKIVPNILQHSKRDINFETIQRLLECLSVCMQEFPGTCGEFKKHIVTHITRLVDVEPHLLNTVAKCFALSSQVKSKGTEGVSYQALWKTNQLVLIHNLHHYLDLLFKNVDEIQTAHRPSDEGVNLLVNKQFKGQGSQSDKMQFIRKYIRGLSKFLQSMLLSSFPVAKTVMPDSILGVVIRGLAVTCHSLGQVTTDSIALGAVLPAVHIDLLNVLIALITCCGRNLIQYGSVICKLLNQELKWTSSSDWPYAMDKPYSRLRSTIYCCLRCWLSTARAASSIDKVLDETVHCILQDIHVRKPTITLQAASGSPTKKNNSQYNFLSDSRGDKLGTSTANKELCFHALKSLQLILYSSAVFIKSSLCKIIQESVITLLFEVQNTHDGPPIPYSNNLCRKELYSTLHALCMEPHPTFPLPLNYALAIFKAGVVDPVSEISVTSITALSSLEKIVHPSAPPLGCTVQYEALQSNRTDSDVIVNGDNVNNSSPCRQSINDIPLSAFPNLNNVIVVKVLQNDGSKSKEFASMHSPSVQSIHKTTINSTKALSQNYQNLGDVIRAGDSDELSNDMTENEALIDNDNGIVVNSVENGSESVSLFSKINGIPDSKEDHYGSIENSTTQLIAAEHPLENIVNPINSIIRKPDLEINGIDSMMNGVKEEPPVKRLKTLHDNASELADKGMSLTNNTNDAKNGDTDIINEEDMMNCFVDIVQE